MSGSRSSADLSHLRPAEPASPYTELLLRPPLFRTPRARGRWREEPELEDADPEVQLLPPGPALPSDPAAPPPAAPPREFAGAIAERREEAGLADAPDEVALLTEISAEDPLVERHTPAYQRRRWWWSRWRETPCWLTSLVLHLAALVLLGSLLFPESPDQLQHWLQVVLLSEPTPERAYLEVATSPQTRPEVVETEVELKGDAAPDTPEPEEAPPPEPPPAEPEPLKESEEEPTEEPEPLQDFPGGEFVAAERERIVLEPAAPQPLDPALLARGVNDDVVDAFILYDIGRLTGEAGVQARNEFSALGTDSIPALVRGLNRSASIHASCPVMVISQKLYQTVSQSDDPRMIRYAIDQIGRGVPSTAPHRARLDSLAARLRTQFLPPRETARELLVSRGVPPRPALVDSMLAVSGLSPNGLAKALEEENPELQLAATIEVTLRPTGFAHDAQCVELARRLIPLLDSENPEQSSHAQLALCCLAGGDMSAEAESGEPLAEFWSRWFTAFDEERVAGPRIQSLMRMAEALDSAGRFDAADRRYREVLREYPNSLAARKAAQILANRSIPSSPAP